MSSQFGLRSFDSLTTVFFDLDPNPVPFFAPQRIGSQEVTLATLASPGVIGPGQAVDFDMGSDPSTDVLEVHLVKVTQATFNSLLGLYRTVKNVFYTPNNFVNYWQVQWQFGNRGFDLKFIKGTPYYEGDLRFFNVAQIQ